MTEKFTIIKDNGEMFPMGVTRVEGGIHVTMVSKAKECALVLYKKGKMVPAAKLPFPQESRTGNVWSMTVKGSFEGLEYAFEEDGREVPDIYGRRFTGWERWGSGQADRPLHAVFDAPQSALPQSALQESALQLPTLRQTAPQPPVFNWENDQLPSIPFENEIIYHIHPRGFTKHASSGLQPSIRGTFKAVAEKIPYLKELGITTVELMPPVEFHEVLGEERLNYWGYGPAFHFAPKAAYSCGPEHDAERELKELVKALHGAGLELIVELYFNGKEAPVYVLEAVRFWAREYHVDGVHLVGFAPLKLLAEDPYLADFKLYADSWQDVDFGEKRHLADYNQSFMQDMRGFLKGDEGKLNSVAFHTRNTPKEKGCVNYMANANGFTLMDAVSYERKHNESNGEENRDGTDFNQTWNCGVEGPTRKKKVVQMRRKQLRNAILLLMLSQGTPLLMGGDEFGRTKKGNNNSYCQDNEISWLNWDLLKANQDIYEFTKYAISFRKAHPIFHMAKEPALLDYDSVGIPDVSYHGVKAWCPEFDDFRRQLGIFYCGKYGKKPDGSEEDYFYVAYNMHWEPHEFALPNLPKGKKWHLAFDTDNEELNGIYPEEAQKPLKTQKAVMVMARSIAVLVGKDAGEDKGEKEHVK